jgi:hypothetical protein
VEQSATQAVSGAAGAVDSATHSVQSAVDNAAEKI